MRFETDTTICAIATGDFGAPRGIIRITGPDTLSLLADLFGASQAAWTARRSPHVVEASLPLPSLGEVHLAIFCWPTRRSYTGQPSAELHMLGAPVVLREVQNRLLDRGARLAQPGEFTLRAYLAGRLDLTQCEAVLGLIHAKGDRALRVALQQLAGGLAAPLERLRRDLIDLLADLEAGLDFVDEDIEFVSKDEVLRRLAQAQEHLTKLQSQLDRRSSRDLAPRVVLSGLPNSGKSSLFNALSRAELAIASQVPGTTRDYLRTRHERNGVEFDLIDTAGIEQSLQKKGDARSATPPNSPDERAQSMTMSQLGDADLVLYCTPIDAEAVDRDRECLEYVIDHAGGDVWRVVTKSDSLATTPPDEEPAVPQPGVARTFKVSALRGQGLSDLLDAIAAHLAQSRELEQDVVPMTGQRCRDALVRASERIQDAWMAAETESGDEVVASDLRLALDELGQVAGTVVNNDVLDALFRRFCIGK